VISIETEIKLSLKKYIELFIIVKACYCLWIYKARKKHTMHSRCVFHLNTRLSKVHFQF